MKFPKVTVILVTGALLYVLWEQYQAPSEPVEASRFENLRANPVERSVVVDYVIEQAPALCQQTTGEAAGTDAHAGCVQQSESRTSPCRRTMYDQFPEIIASDRVFRDLSISMMNCLMPRSGVIDPAS
ncbi:hypothetical protein LPB19_16645 [Marinobacter salinisoli]|uniref:Uncharacterized protein n=1 Tax=Marinobacter salinisoli TaxID=2769486 RepID=A0ABX7MTL0_9GAMM|nr:hypothetical protein [Marinobacter salinisoli]QSP94775.1 hypothetical protein LPB19_16645 [Marinobacter salinisoli]